MGSEDNIPILRYSPGPSPTGAHQVRNGGSWRLTAIFNTTAAAWAASIAPALQARRSIAALVSRPACLQCRVISLPSGCSKRHSVPTSKHRSSYSQPQFLEFLVLWKPAAKRTQSVLANVSNFEARGRKTQGLPARSKATTWQAPMPSSAQLTDETSHTWPTPPAPPPPSQNPTPVPQTSHPHSENSNTAPPSPHLH